jgi:biopolymer transport protein ExbD
MWGFVSVMLAILAWIWFGGLPHPAYAYGGVGDRAVAEHSTPEPGALKEDALLINITSDGTIYFRNHRVRCEDLPNEIREGVRNGAEKKIYLAVDARAKYGRTKQVLEQIRIAGIENASFLTQKPYR